MERVARQYVEFSEGDYFVNGGRVLLEAVVSEFLDGRSPETIQQSFPALKLAEIYGAIAFYLDHQTARPNSRRSSTLRDGGGKWFWRANRRVEIDGGCLWFYYVGYDEQK